MHSSSKWKCPKCKKNNAENTKCWNCGYVNEEESSKHDGLTKDEALFLDFFAKAGKEMFKPR
jgi:hypothetical protein